jgi:signal transduction histidine kinase
MHPDDIAAAEAAGRRSFKDGTPLSVEYRMIARDGRVVWVREQASLFRDDHGVPKFWQGVYVDITELKRAEEELNTTLHREQEVSERLRALDEMKNTFLQAVSHDLRTPLAAILGLAITLEREEIELEPLEVRELASRIAFNSRKLDRMVSDLLDLDRLSRGIVEPKLQQVDIGALVRDLVDQFVLDEGREVVLDIEPVTIPVDPPKVERIVENLLANAVRHTPRQARVWIRTRTQDGGALIIVEDEGPGVALGLRGAVFEPFRQGPSPSSHSPGAGVGLALVARFSELHGGRAWIEDRDGGGASFRVFLPGAVAG